MNRNPHRGDTGALKGLPFQYFVLLASTNHRPEGGYYVVKSTAHSLQLLGISVNGAKDFLFRNQGIPLVPELTVCTRFTPCLGLFSACQAAALDLREKSPSFPPTGQQRHFPKLTTGPVHFPTASVLLGSSNGQSPMPPLSERNGSLRLVLLSRLTADAFWREGIWVQGRPRLLMKTHLLAAGSAADGSKALPTYMHIKPKGWKETRLPHQPLHHPQSSP